METEGSRLERGIAIGLGLAVLGLLALFAWRYADERLYADSGYYLFRVVNENGFHIEHGRWVLALAEALPLLGVKIGLPMDALIPLHSLANVLFLTLSMSYALLLLKDRRAALLLAMAQVIGLAHGLFCPVFELYYGVGLVLLFHATATNDRLEGRTRMALSIALFIVALSSHPMAWPLLLGSVILLDHRARRPLVLLLVAITVAFALVRGLNMSTYEAAQLSFLQRLAFPSLILDLFKPDTLLMQLRRVLLHYPDVLVLAAFTVTALWRGGRRRTAWVYLAGLLGLYIAIGLYMPDATHDRYREQVDFAFTAWTLLVILAGVWRIEAWRIKLLILLVVCVGFRVMNTVSIAPYYAARTQWHMDLIAQARERGLSKVIIVSPTIAFGTMEERVAPYWSTGVETMLLSAKDGAKRTVSVITEDDAQCAATGIASDQVVLRCGDVLELEAMNPAYYRLPSAEYEKMEKPDPPVLTR